MALKLAALVAAGIALASQAFAQDVLDIRIAASTTVDNAPAFVGVEKGIFAKHGLNPEIIMYPTGVEMINGLLADAHDVNVMGSIPYLAAASRGLPVVLIGNNLGDPTQNTYSIGHSIVVSEKSGVAGVNDLKGKRIGLPRGTGAEGYLVGLLQANGLAADDATLINVKPESLVTGLAQDDIDAIVCWEPWPSAALVNVAGSTRIASGGCESCYDPGTLITSKDKIANKAEALRRFVAAYAEAQQWVRNDYDGAAEIDMHWIPGIDLEVMKGAVREAVYDLRLSKYTRDMYMKKTIPSLVEAGRVDAVFDPGPYIDAQFYLDAEAKYPEYFSDLPPIADELRLN